MPNLDFESKKNKKTRYLGMAIMVVLIVVTGYFIFRDNGISAILPYMKQANPFFIGLGFLLMFIFVACESTNIYMILSALGQRVGWRRCFSYGFVGFYFSAITPSSTGGQPAQLYYMKKDNINLSYSTIALLIIIMFYMVVSLGLAAIIFLVNYSFIISIIKPIWVLVVYGAVANILAIVGLFFVIFSPGIAKRFCGFCIRLLGRLKIIKNMDNAKVKVDEQINEYQLAAIYIKQNPFLVVKVILVTIVQLSAVFLVPFCVYKAFGLNSFSIIDVFSTQALLTIAVASLPLPGAVGAAEGCFVKMFKLLFPTQLLLPAMVLSRGIAFYSIVLISALVVLFVHWRTSKRTAFPTSA